MSCLAHERGPGARSAHCCLPARTMLPFHTKCSDEDTKNQKNHHLTRKCGGRMDRKREVVISYSLLSPPRYRWSPLEKFALCRVGLHACSSDCYLHDIAWSQRPWQTSCKTSSTGRTSPVEEVWHITGADDSLALTCTFMHSTSPC